MNREEKMEAITVIYYILLHYLVDVFFYFTFILLLWIFSFIHIQNSVKAKISYPWLSRYNESYIFSLIIILSIVFYNIKCRLYYMYLSYILVMQNKSSKETFESFYQWVIIFSKIRLLQGKVLSQYRRNSIGLKVKKLTRE